jgi:hypothetical protein
VASKEPTEAFKAIYKLAPEHLQTLAESAAKQVGSGWGSFTNYLTAAAKSEPIRRNAILFAMVQSSVYREMLKSLLLGQNTPTQPMEIEPKDLPPGAI